jgi:hypothetical protein
MRVLFLGDGVDSKTEGRKEIDMIDIFFALSTFFMFLGTVLLCIGMINPELVELKVGFTFLAIGYAWAKYFWGWISLRNR